ncbi:unnamed protein product [Brachionus calyciflorus]|uniref:peptidylprolyl isomerase n=1 Tax=Brachionus calyciflorus TaxID=104777 RepID=A0A813QIE9_9BILA|nr:unnamed protein product [Brachionus calyciflorus]
MSDNPKKRSVESESDDSGEEWVGPKQSENNNEASNDENSQNSVAEESPQKVKISDVKKRKNEEFEKLYLENLPSSENYEKSYMHRDTITHLIVTATDFVITGSMDGHVKFWKKQDEGIEFVKHFRTHLSLLMDMTDNFNGTLLCTISLDKSMKIFDIINFDMINMIRLDFVPFACSFIHADRDPVATICVSEKDTAVLRVFDARGGNQALHKIEKMHYQPVHLIRFNPIYEIAVSTDRNGMLEYWTGPLNDYKFPKNVLFESKMDTDLYEFVKVKTIVINITFTKDGRTMAVLSKDRKIRLFNFLTGKIIKTVDESLDQYSALQQNSQQLGNMEFGRRMAMEKDIERNEATFFQNMVFDESGMFLIYGTLMGVKILNVETLETVKYLGKLENARFLHVGIFQGITNKPKAIISMEMRASNNPALQIIKHDPTLFCTAYKKNRVYLFTKREPEDTKGADNERDVFNEKPTKEEIVAATEESTMSRLASTAIIHTTMGDIVINLFCKECPKTVENFAVHSRNGYYNGHIFHRVIKQFMIQTGDPQGNGTGGTSIWGHEFEDEFHPNLKHDKPYTVSMANAGPNTNGSQFFITVIPCPWLDKKHTVFGRVVKGMDVVQKISNAKTDKQDKPQDEIKIISISVK